MQLKLRLLLMLLTLFTIGVTCSLGPPAEVVPLIPKDVMEAAHPEDAQRLAELNRVNGDTATRQAVDTFHALTHGFLNLEVPQASPPTNLGAGCWPPQYPNAATGYLTVDANGVLEGKCTFGDPGKNDAYGELSGQIDSLLGTLTFHLAVTQSSVASNGTTTIHYVVDGKAALVRNDSSEVTVGSGAKANGPATFTWTCTSDGVAYCGGNPPNYVHTVEKTGTVPFRLQFYTADGH